ncbi:hypothetical protein Cfor_08691, partial [Coptotermes formosanus]
LTPAVEPASSSQSPQGQGLSSPSTTRAAPTPPGPEVPKEVAVSTEVSSLGPRGSAPFTVASSMLLLHTQ